MHALPALYSTFDPICGSKLFVEPRIICLILIRLVRTLHFQGSSGFNDLVVETKTNDRKPKRSLTNGNIRHGSPSEPRSGDFMKDGSQS